MRYVLMFLAVVVCFAIAVEVLRALGVNF